MDNKAASSEARGLSGQRWVEARRVDRGDSARHRLLQPPRQELAGHRELGMTQSDMHLSPVALDSAIRLLDQAGPPEGGHYVRAVSQKSFGDILETAVETEGTING